MSVRGLTGTFQGGRWAYGAPAVYNVTPAVLQPSPALGDMLTVHGINFGFQQGNVTLGTRRLVCPAWTNDRIECVAPPGVVPAATVTVTAASSRVSSPQGASTSASTVQYAPPIVSSVAIVASDGREDVLVAGSRGGRQLVVTGTSFGAPSLPMSLWLVREGGSPMPPWGSASGVSWAGGPTVLRCASTTLDAHGEPVAGNSSSPPPPTSLQCVWPAGSGIGWQLVVVNHDGADVASSTVWRVSAPSSVQLKYRPPQVLQTLALSTPVAVGGFLLSIRGMDFSVDASAVVVTVGRLPCVVLENTVDHEGLTCRAPPRQVDTNSDVVVGVGLQYSVPHTFTYASPFIDRVFPPVLDAVSGSSPRVRLTLYGANFGSLYREDLASNHTVHVGPYSCGALKWTSDSDVSCALEGTVVVGQYSVSIIVGGTPSTTPVSIFVNCPRDTYGQAGQLCTPCPTGATCPGRDADPLSLPGYYPVSVAQFVACAPPAACVGGISAANVNDSGQASAGCARNYMGTRCGMCGSNAYRSKGRCATCPNTAWLLFLLFSLAILAAVIAATYLSKKRINLAGLSIGVVGPKPC